MERRHADRVPVEYSAAFSGLIFEQGLILELSVAGCRARCTGEICGIMKDDSIKVLIDVPRYKDPLHINLATVRWTKGKEFGLEFIEMERDERRRLRELIQAIKAARRDEKGH